MAQLLFVRIINSIGEVDTDLKLVCHVYCLFKLFSFTKMCYMCCM